MSRPKYGWWGYVKDMIRRYPTLSQEYADLHTQAITPQYGSAGHGGGGARRVTEDIAIRELPQIHQREYNAVRQAIEKTEKLPTGSERLRLIDLVFFKATHTLDGAAVQIHCSYRTARRYHADFIMLVAGGFGLLD